MVLTLRSPFLLAAHASTASSMSRAATAMPASARSGRGRRQITANHLAVRPVQAVRVHHLATLSFRPGKASPRSYSAVLRVYYLRQLDIIYKLQFRD
jgi:hypothetical protein